VLLAGLLMLGTKRKLIDQIIPDRQQETPEGQYSCGGTDCTRHCLLHPCAVCGLAKTLCAAVCGAARGTGQQGCGLSVTADNCVWCWKLCAAAMNRDGRLVMLGTKRKLIDQIITD
jgi:hypothetical protein